MKTRLITILSILALIPLESHSRLPASIQPQRKAALVIGNGNYLTSILSNPENDADSMSEVLLKLGFVVYKYENLTQSQMKKAIDDFGEKLKLNDVGLFYYAGHGIQSNGYNYLIPVDAQLTTERQVEYDCVQADRILALMEGSGTKVNIIILDACRNNPFERSWTRSATGKGLAFMNAPKGTLIAYATSPGNTASDGGGKNGLYTSAILENIMIPNVTILQMFQQVRSTVSKKSDDLQTPWESTSLTGDFYFNNMDTVNSKNQDNIPVTALNRTTVYDQIYKLNGEILNVRIIKISSAIVDYNLAGQDNILRQEPVANLLKIVYANCREEILSRSDYSKINGPDDWQLVNVTEDKALIAGLTQVKKLKASSSWGGTRGTDMGLNNCIRKLKKEAASLGCSVVLLTDKKMGVITSVNGIAYR